MVKKIEIWIKRTAKKYVVFTALGRKIYLKRAVAKNYTEKALQLALDQYLPIYGNQILMSEEDLRKDIKTCEERFLLSPEEYFLFRLWKRDDSERSLFISDLERVNICNHLNRLKNQECFDNKSKTYRIFKSYYRRDVFTWDSRKPFDTAAFNSFYQKHDQWIVKPVDGSFGMKVQKIARSQMSTAEDAIAYLKSQYAGGFILEEVVEACPELSAFHPKSLNTIRIPTIHTKAGVDIVCPFMRLGQGDSIVDNAGAGGIICALDEKSGVVLAAMDEKGREYETHPDSGLRIIGFQVPRWEEACAFAKELAEVLPDNRYTGWDLALTEKGWIMIEGNAKGQFVWQMPMQKGMRPIIQKYL